MRISKIHVYQTRRPFDISFHSGQAIRTTSESIILQVDYETGISSYGESAPRIYVTGESLSSVAGLILDSFAPLLLHREVRTLEDVKAILSDLEGFCFQRNSKPYNSALSAVDIALLDGLGQFERQSMAFYLGPSRKGSTPHSVSIPFLPDEQILQLFLRFHQYPFSHVKVLVGEDLSWNARRLGLLRSLLGERVDLRIEVNGKWDFEQAMAHVNELKKFRISAVEQPLPAHDIEGLRRFREASGIRVVADESFCTLSDAKELIEHQACDILNIKVSKCGGLLRSKAIADFAHSAHVSCQLGAHVGETEILAAAGRHFVSATNLLWAEGGYSFLLFGKEGRRRQGVADERDPRPGLGFDPRNEQEEIRDWEEILPSPVTNGPT
jgi:muconate cycloisomerase